MSRARRPITILRPRQRWTLYDVFFPGRTPPIHASEAFAFERAAKCRTRPSILRGALIGRPISARAAARLLARLGGA